jgi:hypothetical protein
MELEVLIPPAFWVNPPRVIFDPRVMLAVAELFSAISLFALPQASVHGPAALVAQRFTVVVFHVPSPPAVLPFALQ